MQPAEPIQIEQRSDHVIVTAGAADRDWFRGIVDRAASIPLYANAPDVAHLRKAFLDFAASPVARAVPADVTIADVDVQGISASWFRPAESERAPTILYFHGGGYVCGGTLGARGVAGSLAHAFGAPVLAVGYRQSPEHPFPAAVLDANKSYAWLVRQIQEPILIVGDSAGGGLAVTVALEAVRSGIRAPWGVIAISGVFDMAMAGESWRINAGKDLATREMGGFLYGTYLDGAAPDDPLASPAYRRDFASAPPMMVLAGSHEVMLDDAEMLVAQARASGASVQYEIYEGMPHNFVKFARPIADTAYQRMVDWAGTLVATR